MLPYMESWPRTAPIDPTLFRLVWKVGPALPLYESGLVNSQDLVGLAFLLRSGRDTDMDFEIHDNASILVIVPDLDCPKGKLRPITPATKKLHPEHAP